MRIAHVNQDPGISPTRKKGAAVHLTAMRAAFEALGASVLAVDEADPARGRHALERAHADAPLDLVYERYALGRFEGAAFARRAGVPFVLEVNAPLADEAARYRGGPQELDSELDAELDARLFREASWVLCVSEPVAEFARGRGATPERVLVRPNGVDADLFRPRAGARGDESIPEDRVVIGFHGRLRPWHNLEMLVEALERLVLSRGLPLHLVTVGEGPFEETLADRLPAHRVTHVGWCEKDELARRVADFDVLPLTYAPDQPCYFSPLKLLEGMACGAVPVVPDLGDLASVVAHEARGLVYAPGDVDALTAALDRLVRDEALRRRLSESAVLHARRSSWRDIASDVLAHALPGVEA